MLKFYCYSLLLFGLLGLSLNANPGVKVRATQKWLDYIQTVGMDVLRQMLQDEPLPDIKGSTRMFGAVEYSITGIRVDTFEFQKTSAIPVVGTDVDVTIVDASAKAHGNWKVHHWLIKDRGGFTLSLSGVNIAATLTTYQDRYNRPSVFLSKCHSHVEGGSIKFSGSLSWLYNLFSTFLEKPICNNLSQKLCPRVADGITVLQKELSTFRVEAQIDTRAEVEYYLVMPPAVAMQHIDLSLKGTVYPVGNHVESPFPIHTIQLPSNSDSMLFIGLSEFFFNSVGFTYFTTGALKLTITNKEFPDALWLKTSDYNKEIPDMPNHYPESRPVMMAVSATKVPVVSLTPGILHLEFFGFLAAVAVLPDSSTKPIFSLKLEVNLSTSDLRVSDFNLTGSFHLKRYQISSVTSNVGLVSDAALHKPVHYLLTSILVPSLNEGLRNGIPIPSLANISLTETEVKIDQGSVLILTDMFYIPWRNSLKGLLLGVWSAE